MCIGMANGVKTPKMTDEQIKKALEICSITNMVLECKDCPYDTFNARNCTTKLCEDALDLINRQQAEIERLNYILIRDNQRQTKKEQKDGDSILTLYELYDKEVAENKKLNAEIERLQEDSKRLKKVQMQLDDAMKMYSTIKAEAIKEFAERLKEHLKGNGGLYCVTTMNAQIDNLVKEMVGEGK
jgi:signal transduction protein with GAF and PtsI domain